VNAAAATSLLGRNVRHSKAPIYADRRWLDELDAVDAQGCVDVPLWSGLGVELDWTFINAHKQCETDFE
jgi:hypothetical protein